MKRVPRFLVRLGSVASLLACLSAPGSPQALAASPAPERVIQLPPFFVDDSHFKFSVWNWGYMAFPGYEVLTYCDRVSTDSFVAGVSRQISIFRRIAPAVFETEPSVPTSLILMDANQEATISEDMKRVMKERPTDTNTAMNSLSTHRVYLPQLRLNDSESTAINLILGNLSHIDVVVLEPVYVRYLLETRTPRLPTWYVEATTDLYRRAYFGSTSATFSPISWTDDKETTALQEDPKHKRALLPMESILFTRPGSGGSDEEEKTRVRLWECQSELLLQWVIADKSLHRIASLKRFLDSGDEGQRNERALRECFGLGYSQLGSQLNAFLPQAVTDSVTFYSDSDGITVPLRDATTSEYARIWGNWERMEIQFVNSEDPLLIYPYVSQADRTLKGGYRKGERDSGFLAVLGLYGVERDDLELARPVLESAVAAHASHPRAYDELARMRFKEAHAHPSGPGAKLSPEQVGSILALLREARKLSPPQSVTYLMYALTLANSSMPPSPSDLDVLAEGRLRFPSEPELATMMAELRDPNGSNGAPTGPYVR